MVVSDARREANRRNAQLSTGPKTQAGKDRSRMNALKHGLRSEVVRSPEDSEAIRGRARSWLEALKPQNTYHAWLMEEIAVLTHRIDRCGRIERRARDAASIRAEESWEEDGRSKAEGVGLDLANRPASVVDELRRTPQGCDWLIDRWARLARAADRNGGRWTDDQRRLAFDLLGTPAEFRDGEPGEVVDHRGEVVEPATDPATLARREIESLEIRREQVAESDRFARSMVEADLMDDASPEVGRLRRYEASLHRRLRWCVAQVAFESPRPRANSDLALHYFPAEAPAEPAPSTISTPIEPGPETTLVPGGVPDPSPIVPDITTPEVQVEAGARELRGQERDESPRARRVRPSSTGPGPATPRPAKAKGRDVGSKVPSQPEHRTQTNPPPGDRTDPPPVTEPIRRIGGNESGKRDLVGWPGPRPASPCTRPPRESPETGGALCCESSPNGRD